MRTFVTQEIAKLLNLKPIRKEKLFVYSFGSRNAQENNYDVVRLELKNKNHSDRNISIEALVTPTISAALLMAPSKEIKKEIEARGLEIADTCMSGEKINILLGSDVYWNVINPSRIEKLTPSLYAIDTIFGFTVVGRNETETTNMFHIAVNNISIDIQKGIEKFWSLEGMGILNDSNVISKKENEIIEEFEKQITFKNKRYETNLLWRSDQKKELESNFEVSKRRFINISDELKRDNWVSENYKRIVEDQLKLGIVEECPNNIENSDTYYMPHRPVVREDKLSTQVRMVFDASSKKKYGKSLNDCLISGPNLNPNILDIILKFRKHKIVFCADIEKAFLQIGIADADRDFLRFLWFEDSQGKNNNFFKILRMTRVPFGVTCSPFILSATIKYHIKKYKENKNAYEMLNSSLYVDDLYYGQNKVEDAFRLSVDAVEILKGANMNLRKFSTNSEELRKMWKESNLVNTDAQTDNKSLKVLGIIWDNDKDVFKLDVQALIDSLSSLRGTKRNVLQTAAKIYDPVGFITPFVIRIKLLMQNIWERGFDWDTELTEDLMFQWHKWCSEIELLKEITIPRYFLSEDPLRLEIQLHIFCDASPLAFGALAYFRCEDNKGISTHFICSKSRVAPLKKLTLPRLELLGAVLAARLFSFLKTLFPNLSKNVYFWTDSQIVLNWIKGSPNQWKPFVANRVSEIHSLSDPLNWNFCRGKENPCDLLTRGIEVTTLIDNTFWWHGPKWLIDPVSVWPKLSERKLEDSINDERRVKIDNVSILNCAQIPTEELTPLFDIRRFGSLMKVYRITAFIHRFVNNLKNPKSKKTGELTAEDINKAEIYWIKSVQKKEFHEELNNLIQGRPVDKKSRIYEFSPQLDENGLICVGGRLQRSKFNIREKHPWLILGDNWLITLIVNSAHNEIMHLGIASTLSKIREKIWILRGRQIVKTIISRCIICRKFNVKAGQQITAPLPSDRITESPPFAVSGIDFAGPLYIKVKNSTEKCYILLCTCAVSRAVHLELVHDLSTESFLLAFRRFISRRGLCRVIYSDNAQTFKRAEKELNFVWNAINHPDVQAFYSSKRIEWKYIAPRAAWWGGFWERMVKTVKSCLRKVLGKSSLNADELETILVEIEAIINCRPMTYLYNDPKEPSCLTPAHFLTGEKITSLPPIVPDIIDRLSKREQLTKKYYHRQKLLNHFWQRWKREYLLLLKSVHSKKSKNCADFKVNDIVLVEDKNVPRTVWKMGRIIEAFPGRDGKIRSCCVKLSNGTIKRPIQLLYNLEITD